MLKNLNLSLFYFFPPLILTPSDFVSPSRNAIIVLSYAVYTPQGSGVVRVTAAGEDCHCNTAILLTCARGLSGSNPDLITAAVL